MLLERLQHMLRNTSKHVNQNMIDNEVGFNIIAIKEKMTDLPEHSHMKGLEKGYEIKAEAWTNVGNAPWAKCILWRRKFDTTRNKK